MSAVSRLGSLWVAAIALAGIAVLLAGGYVLVIGGVFDLLGGRTLSSGSAWLDERNRTFVLRHGRQATGALKLVLGLAWIVFTPAAVSAAQPAR